MAEIRSSLCFCRCEFTNWCFCWYTKHNETRWKHLSLQMNHNLRKKPSSTSNVTVHQAGRPGVISSDSPIRVAREQWGTVGENLIMMRYSSSPSSWTSTHFSVTTSSSSRVLGFSGSRIDRITSDKRRETRGVSVQLTDLQTMKSPTRGSPVLWNVQLNLTGPSKLH